MRAGCVGEESVENEHGHAEEVAGGLSTWGGEAAVGSRPQETWSGQDG